MSYRPVLYCTHRPGPPLDCFVEQLWYWEGAPFAHAKDRLLPSGSSGLIVNLVEDETRYGGPGGTWPFFDPASDELHNQQAMDGYAGDWTDVAQSCGYFDQSHLIRECRSMSGFTPTELAARRVDNSGHVTLS